MESVITLGAFLALGRIRCLLEPIILATIDVILVGNRLSWLLRLTLHAPDGLLPQAILTYTLHLLRDLHTKSFLLFILHANLLERFSLSRGHLFFNSVKYLLLLLLE